MVETTELAIEDFSLPEQQQAKATLAEISQFQALVRSSLKSGHDFGVIPGTNKSTLLKPGAEKIAKLLGLADTYEVMEQTVDWDKGLFQYVIKTSLVSIRTGQVVAQGMGECNSYESRYRYRWIWPRELSDYGYSESSGLRERRVRNGGKQYRVQNTDPADQVNTILKMAKKRALVDAALSVGSLSDLFAQDLEPTSQPTALQAVTEAPPAPPSNPPRQPHPPTPNPHEVDNVMKELRDKLNRVRQQTNMTMEHVVEMGQAKYDVTTLSELTAENLTDFVAALSEYVPGGTPANEEASGDFIASAERALTRATNGAPMSMNDWSGTERALGVSGADIASIAAMLPDPTDAQMMEALARWVLEGKPALTEEALA